jgi:hypothetical protein
MHPYLFPEAEDPNADEFGEHLIDVSRKLQFLDKLFEKTERAGE